MEFYVNSVPPHKELSININNAYVETGMCDEKGQKEIAIKLLNAAIKILPPGCDMHESIIASIEADLQDGL